MKNILFLSTLIIVLILTGCASPPLAQENPVEYTSISVETLQSMMNDRRESFLLVNSHIPFEGNLPTTDISIAYNETAQNLAQFPEDKDSEIVLYCMSDAMSHTAGSQLVAEGYTNVKVLDGGMIAWQSAGGALDMEP